MLKYHDTKRPTMAECLTHKWFDPGPKESSAGPPVQFVPLLEFCRGMAARRSLLLDIAAQLPMKQAHQIVDAFKSFDANGDGCVSPAELQDALARMGMSDEALAQQVFKVLDANRDGTLSFTEFAAGILLAFKDVI